jgi:hypothetical protein
MGAPLADLYKNTNQDSSYSLQYPSDLATKRKSHYVLFTIFESISNSERGADGQAPSGGVDANGNITVTLPAGAEVGENAANLVKSTSSGVGLTNRGLTVTTKVNPVGNISLYIPDDVVIEQAAQYGKVSLEDAINTIVPGGAIKGLTSYIKKDQDNGAPGALLLNYLGYVFNPQEQVMFEGIDFRRYSMSFTFTPRSKGEAETVRNIIQSFRQHAAPKITTGSLGFFFTPPSQFNVSYRFSESGNPDDNGTVNPFINNYKRSVLESVAVNYAPNGWSAHDNGSPVQTTLTLNFQEIELVDKIDIRDGGY